MARKNIALIIVIAVILALFTGCGKQSSSLIKSVTTEAVTETTADDIQESDETPEQSEYTSDTSDSAPEESEEITEPDSEEITETESESEATGGEEYDITDAKLPDWETTDPETMKRLIENDPGFPFRYMLTFIPSYTPDNASELMSTIVSNLRYTNYTDFFPDLPSEEGYYKLEDIEWYLQNIFNISDNGIYDARMSWISGNRYSGAYKEGFYRTTFAGAPSIETEVAVKNISYDAGRWIVIFDYVYPYDDSEPSEDTYTHSFDMTCVLERKEINGLRTWTMCSLDKTPYISYKNDVINMISYRWNTIEEPYTIINNMADINIPEGLHFHYRINYSVTGDVHDITVNLGKNSSYESHITIMQDHTVNSLEDAMEGLFSRRERYYQGVSGHKISYVNTISISGQDFAYFEEKNPWNENNYSDFYVGCMETSSGDHLYVEWEFRRSPYSVENITVEDWQVQEIINNLDIH